MPDEWTAIQFDSAVSYFGTWVENKLNETDPKTHKPVHRLSDLLADTQAGAVDFFAVFGEKTDTPDAADEESGAVKRWAKALGGAVRVRRAKS